MGQGIGIGRERGSADEGKLLIRNKFGNLFILDYDKSSVAGEVRGVGKVKRRPGHIGNPRLDIGKMAIRGSIVTIQSWICRGPPSKLPPATRSDIS